MLDDECPRYVKTDPPKISHSLELFADTEHFFQLSIEVIARVEKLFKPLIDECGISPSDSI